MKTYLIYGLIISLIIAGLLGIGVLLSGKFEELQIRILFTTLAFTVYSIIGLCCNSIIKSQYSVFGKLGLGVTMFALLYAVVTTWVEVDDFIQLRFSLLIISLCFAHCSLMLRVKTYGSLVSVSRTVSIFASVLATMIAVTILSSSDIEAGPFKLLGVVSIVGVIATIIAPTLAFTISKTIKKDV